LKEEKDMLLTTPKDILQILIKIICIDNRYLAVSYYNKLYLYFSI